jgi:hypothetical protein
MQRGLSENAVNAKFGIASLQTTQDRRRASNERGGPSNGKRSKERTALTL